MYLLHYRVFADNPDEASIKIREKHENIIKLTIIEVNSPRKDKGWFEYAVLLGE